MKKIAIVYDWFDSWGGVERVLLKIHALLPGAHFYGAFVDYKKAPWCKPLKPKTSFLQYMPVITRKRAVSAFLLPYAFESFNFDQYDLVISITSSYAKGIITKPDTRHICWILSPTRFLWLYPEHYKLNGLLSIFQQFVYTSQRIWDYIAAQRPDEIWSISRVVNRRVKEIYNLESEIMYVPFDKNYWDNLAILSLPVNEQYINLVQTPYYLVVSRLEPYKKVELAIATCNALKKRLIIVGSGTQLQNLQKIAGNTITFLQNVSDYDLAYLYSRAMALIMPQEEDYGLVSLEAQTCGCKVIAYGFGGAKETIIEFKSGIFFYEQNEASLSIALATYEKSFYNVPIDVQHINSLTDKVFEKEFLSRVAQYT
jgi:glycosyltransferase involved in cell wall biosynthesis